jgi:hypothetical protein
MATYFRKKKIERERKREFLRFDIKSFFLLFSKIKLRKPSSDKCEYNVRTLRIQIMHHHFCKNEIGNIISEKAKYFISYYITFTRLSRRHYFVSIKIQKTFFSILLKSFCRKYFWFEFFSVKFYFASLFTDQRFQPPFLPVCETLREKEKEILFQITTKLFFSSVSPCTSPNQNCFSWRYLTDWRKKSFSSKQWISKLPISLYSIIVQGLFRR